MERIRMLERAIRKTADRLARAMLAGNSRLVVLHEGRLFWLARLVREEMGT